MTFTKADEKTYIVRLEKGEEVISSLQEFAQNQQITNAKIEGIGSIENVTLAHYKVNTKKYSEKQIEGVFEVTTLLGNIGIFEQKPMIHTHITIGNDQMQIFGGHLINGTVSATLELMITTFLTKNEKIFNEEIGLKLWKLNKI